ncbi:MAG: hypothetical protein ACKO6L_01365 [Flavobacteriales bacterium]
MNKRTHSYSAIGLLIALIFSSVHGIAQQGADADSLDSYETVIDGNRKIKLKDQNKISIGSEYRVNEVQLTKIQYTTIPLPGTVNIDPSVLKALKPHIEKPIEPYYRTYIRFGAGSYFTTPLDVSFVDKKNSKHTFGIHYKLIRSSGVIMDDNDSIPDGYSTNLGEAWGKWYFQKNQAQLYGRAYWERNVNHWYGYNIKSDEVNRPSLAQVNFKQRINTVGGEVRFKSHLKKVGEINFDSQLHIRNTADLFNGHETNVDVKGNVQKFLDGTLYSSDIGVNYNTFQFFGPKLDGKTLTVNTPFYAAADTVFENRQFDNALIYLTPTASAHWRELKAKFGASLYLDARGEQRAHFYPVAEVSYKFLDGILVPMIGVEGFMTPTTYLSLYQQNPFIHTFPKLKNQNTKLHAYAALAGSISRAVSYNFGVNYTRFGDFAYFVNDAIVNPANNYYSWGNTFAAIYDDLTTSNVYGELAIYSGEKWKANVRGDYFKYETFREAHAWHQPNVKFTGTAQYVYKKFIFTSDIFYIGERWAKSMVQIEGVEPLASGFYEHKLKGFLDANLRIEYRYNARISAWAQAYNAIAANYQRWNNYPTQRFLGLIGFSYGFR